MNLLTAKEVSNQYRVCRTTVFNWIKRGLPAVKVGRVIRIKDEDIKAFIAAGRMSRADDIGISGQE